MQKISTIVIFLLYSSLVWSQTNSADSIKTPEGQPKNIDFNVMPYISYNRTVDFMLGAIPMMMYKMDKTDTISPKSLSGLAAIYTTNKSYFICSFNKFHFKEDDWRAQFFFITGNQNAQFYMDDLEAANFYDYGTKTTIISVSLLRKVIKSLYGGFGYSYAHYDTTFEDNVKPSSVTHKWYTINCFIRYT